MYKILLKIITILASIGLVYWGLDIRSQISGELGMIDMLSKSAETYHFSNDDMPPIFEQAKQKKYLSDGLILVGIISTITVTWHLLWHYLE